MARLVTAATLVGGVALTCLVDPPLWRFDVDEGKDQRAAITLRGPDPPITLWLSKAFTLPYLKRYYAHTDTIYARSDYVTQVPDTEAQAAFVARLEDALGEYETVDIFILAHTNHYEEWLKDVDPVLLPRLRLVYNAGCHTARWGPAWLDAGARATIAHPGHSQSPIFFFFFLRRWTRGADIEQAMAESNARMKAIITWQERLVPASVLDETLSYQASEALCFGQCKLAIGLVQ
jgi:hypothetical protein